MLQNFHPAWLFGAIVTPIGGFVLAAYHFCLFCSFCPPFLSSLHVVEGFPSAKLSLLPRIIKAHFRACDLVAENKNLCLKFTLFFSLLFSNSLRRKGGSAGRQSMSLLVTAEAALGCPFQLAVVSKNANVWKYCIVHVSRWHALYLLPLPGRVLCYGGYLELW